MRTALVLGLLVGCAEPTVEDVTAPDPHLFAGPNNIYEEEQQGRFLLGSVPDRLTVAGTNHFAVRRDSTNRPGHRASVVNGSLVVRDTATNAVYRGIDDAIDGLELASASGVTVRITSAVTDAFGGPVYDLLYRDATGAWVDYCEAGDVAVPMQGTWTGTGFHASTTDISFGCRDGVTFKCFTWGYVPGAAGSLAHDLHLACTRMARADVCGDGVPHTREETPIVIRDLVNGYNEHPLDAPALQHVTSMPASPDRHFYESAWVAGENKGAVCLERQRWASLPIGTTCGLLADPRVTPNEKYCEQMTDEELQAQQTLLVNASKTQDMYMHRWLNPATADVVTTVRGYYSEGPDRVEPFPGYTEHLGSDGILIRNLPGSLTAADVVEVFSTGATDRVLLPNALLDRTDPTFEGYLLRHAGGDRVPFNVYAHSARVDTVTSVDPDDLGFELERPLYFAITP